MNGITGRFGTLNFPSLIEILSPAGGVISL
jgi:hypothetical protein